MSEWKLIVSDAHANNLLRRELKFRQKSFQRKGNKHHSFWDYEGLLNIKKGNYYKFIKNNNTYCSIIVRTYNDRM